MGLVKKIKCSKCDNQMDVVLTAMSSKIVAKPNEVSVRTESKDSLESEKDKIREFDDYIVVYCDANHKNRIFLKNKCNE